MIETGAKTRPVRPRRLARAGEAPEIGFDLLNLLHATGCSAPAKVHIAQNIPQQRDLATPFTLLLLHLDGFDTIGEHFDRATGDAILAETMARIHAAAGPALISRIGGHEFAILIESVASAADAGTRAANILGKLAHPIPVHGFEMTLRASIGIALCESPENAARGDLLGDADLALRRARKLGQNRWQVFHPEMREHAETRRSLAGDLHCAVERGQLVAHYQPIINLRTQGVQGFEALLRWRHPRHGLLHPGDFIPLAEQTGMISALGEWILREACHQLKIWQNRFPALAPLSMNVNLSARQLDDPGLVHSVRAALNHARILPETLKLELTESALISESESTKAALKNLKALGIGLKLDDFGTGYSSLSNLWPLHFDGLKIDCSFVKKLATDPGIVETMIKLARALDIAVVAEGIEEEQQIQTLLGLGCETGQGFYFSKPLDAETAELRVLRAKQFPPARVA